MSYANLAQLKHNNPSVPPNPQSGKQNHTTRRTCPAEKLKPSEIINYHSSIINIEDPGPSVSFLAIQG
jgi:hypothetical protein